MLKASRHPVARDLVVVTNEDYAHGDGNVVYRWNAQHKIGTRTVGHAGPSPTMQAIRAAIADLS